MMIPAWLQVAQTPGCKLAEAACQLRPSVLLVPCVAQRLRNSGSPAKAPDRVVAQNRVAFARSLPPTRATIVFAERFYGGEGLRGDRFSELVQKPKGRQGRDARGRGKN
jgi:hypothetical protein